MAWLTIDGSFEIASLGIKLGFNLVQWMQQELIQQIALPDDDAFDRGLLI